MIREILFRGKRKDTGEWVYGYFVKDPKGQYRIYYQPFDEATSNTYHFVNPESIGQYTGLEDRNGKKIFESDIVTCEIYEREEYIEQESGIPIKVSYDQGGFYPFYKAFGWRSSVEDIEVIGNVHDNPELLNQTT